MGVAFSILVTIVILGFLWFWIVRPILEDYNLIAPRESVNDYQEAAPVVMSRPEYAAPPSAPSSLQTDSRQTADRPAPTLPSRDVMLNSHKLLRKYGIPREEARAMYKSFGLPLDNNLWSEAATGSETPHVTPVAGRPTSARFETDADYPYQPIEG